MHGNTKNIPSRLGEENKDDIWQRFADFMSDVIAGHIDEMDMDSLPSYTCLVKMDELYASYERLHVLKNEGRRKQEHSRISDCTILQKMSGSYCRKYHNMVSLGYANRTCATCLEL